MITSKNTLIFLALGVVLVGAAAYMFFAGGDDGAAVTATEGPLTDAEFTFITLASQIDRIVFDTAILDDPRFQALQDIRTAVIPEASGKNDPFAPIGGGQSSAP